MCVSSCLGTICWKESHVTLVRSQLPVYVRIYLGAFSAVPLISGSFFHYNHLSLFVFIPVRYVRMYECFCMDRVCLKVCVHLWRADVDVRRLSWLHFVLVIEAGSVSQNWCGYSRCLTCFGICLSLRLELQMDHHVNLAFFWGSGGLTSCLHICTERPLTSGPLSWPSQRGLLQLWSSCFKFNSSQSALFCLCCISCVFKSILESYFQFLQKKKKIR